MLLAKESKKVPQTSLHGKEKFSSMWGYYENTENMNQSYFIHLLLYRVIYEKIYTSVKCISTYFSSTQLKTLKLMTISTHAFMHTCAHPLLQKKIPKT